MAETIGTYTVPEHHVKMYTSNVQAALDKKGGAIYPLMSSGTYVGEKASPVNFIGPIEFYERDTPYSDTKHTQLEHTTRWIVGKEYDAAVLVDRLDTLKMIYDPTSPYVERMREAAARKMDEVSMLSFFAVAKTGKEGTDDTPFKATNEVAHLSTGLNVAKLRALKKLVKKRHIDTRGIQPYLAITADEADDMLAEEEATSFDYAARKRLEDGEISGFMGFRFVPYEDRGDNSGGQSIEQVSGGLGIIRNHPVWVPDGMHKGDWQNLTIVIGPRADKNNIQQIHATFTCGNTRLEEDKVFRLQTTRAAA